MRKHLTKRPKRHTILPFIFFIIYITCLNTSQPALDMLVRIANALDVDVKDLINSTKEEVKFVRIM